MRREGAAVVALLTVVACAACSQGLQAPDGGAGPCSAGFLGTASNPVDFQFVGVDNDYDAVPLADGGTPAILQPPQGGRVIFVGVRATNVDACGLQLTGALRDETSRQVRPDSRTINLTSTNDGWGTTGPIGMSVSGTISNFSNIPVCPDDWSTTDIDGHEYGLEVTIQDRGGRTLTKKIAVTPACSDPAGRAECQCICREGYVLGSDCTVPADGGAE